jgi:hypothetical protein
MIKKKLRDSERSNMTNIFIFVFIFLPSFCSCFAQNETQAKEVVLQERIPAQDSVEVTAEVPAAEEISAPAVVPASAEKSLQDLVNDVRKAKDEGAFQKAYGTADEVMRRFGAEAKKEQKSLNDFPATEQMDSYGTLNGVAQAQFIRAEALKKEGKTQEAIAAFGVVVSDYSYAQAWDSRGWFYKLAEVAKEGIDRLKGIDVNVEKCGSIPTTKIDLNDPGKEEIIDYGHYGAFTGVGTKDYKYVINFQDGLSEAAGEGVYPNTSSVRWDPLYQEVKKQKRLDGSHWDFVRSPDLQAAFFKWALAPEPPGVRQYYTALILEKSGLIKQAIKAYYAVAVHFPYTVGWTYWHTPWYIGPASIARIKHLCEKYPHANMKLEGASIWVENGFDNDIKNDVFIVNPGKLSKSGLPETITDKVKRFIDKKMMQHKVKRSLGDGKVRFVQYENGDWQMLVDGKPYVIKGITYAAVKVGQSPDDGSLKSWMEYDYNNNGKCDGPYDAFLDANHNNKQDSNEPAIGDFELMKKMNVNTIRLYHQPFAIKKELLRELYKKTGIRVIMGDFLGKYALGSGASWFEGTDYESPEHQKAMLESVKQMVSEHKDEPYLLMWLLGNENVYGVACNADKKPDAFFKFANEAAKLIKSLDPDHPVAIASGDTLFLDSFAKYAPEVDVFGANVYRGDSGFGSYWENIKRLVDRPAFVTEYGCAAYVYCYTPEESEEAQADYLGASWRDIRANMAFGKGSGNAIGGVLFEYLDEWWKGYEPAIHDTKGLWVGPFPDGFMHEEWLGVAGQGDGKSSPFLRQLRKSYYSYQKLWKN